MVYSSSQISSLVGGQQVMFANQAAFAQQISPFGGSQPQQMSNPYPDPGVQLAGMGAMAIPGIAAAGGMAASMLGYNNPLGMLDPMTAIGRGFGAGVTGNMGVLGGSHGMGIMHGLRGVGSAFAGGGMRAGVGAVARGAMGGAIAGLPGMVAGMAIDYSAGQAYEGVQNIQDVGRMAGQYMTPQFGMGGAGVGGKPAAGMIKNMTSFMHELVSDDMTSSMGEMRKIMDKAGQMGMLQGIGDANSFKQKFRGIVQQVKAVSQIMGSTLEEAMPVVGQLQQMGLWSSKDVMGFAATSKSLGAGGSQALMGAMQQGAGISHAMGGNLQSGALLGRDLMGTMGAATRLGAFSQMDIKNYTGGVGGVEGQQMMAGGIQRVMAGMGNTAMGRLMMAGLGEVKGNEFTGKMDEALMSKFQRGEISIDELQSRGKSRTSGNQDLAVSFFNKADQMGQNMAAQGGVQGMAQGIQQAMNKAGRGNASSAIQNRFIQLLTGASQKDADMIQKLIQDMPRIQAEQERGAEAALEDSFRQLEEKRHGSMSGLGSAISHALEEGAGRRIQELSESVTTSMSEMYDKYANKLTGQVSQMPKMTVSQAMQRGGRGGSLESLGIKNMGQSFVSGGAFENAIMRTEDSGISGSLRDLVGGGTQGMSLRGETLVNAGLETSSGTAGAGEVQLGRGIKAKLEDVRRIAETTVTRANDATMSGLLGGESAGKRKAMDNLKSQVSKITSDPAIAGHLAELRKKNPGAYQKELVSLLKSQGADFSAFGGNAESAINATAVAFQEMGFNHGPLSMNLDRDARILGASKFKTMDELASFRSENFEKMQDIIGGSLSDVKSLVSGNIDPNKIAAALGGDKGTISELQTLANQGGNEGLGKILQMAGSGQGAELAKLFSNEGTAQWSEYNMKRKDRLAGVAKGMGSISSMRGVSAGHSSKLEEARKALASGNMEGGMGMISALAGSGLGQGEIDALLQGGGVLGKQVGIEASIGNIGAMSGKAFGELKNKLNRAGGIDLFGGGEIEAMMKDGKIDRGEASKLREILKGRASATFGEGAGARAGTNNDLATNLAKFSESNTKFVLAVGKVLGQDIKDAAMDVKNSSPTE